MKKDHNLILIFADAKAVCGESPLWDVSGQRLLWVDNEHERFGIFTRSAADKATTVLNRDYPLSAVAFNDDGRLVVAGPAGISLLAEDGEMVEMLRNGKGGDYFINDALASSAGGLYAGSFHWGDDGMERTGCLYYINPAGQPEVMDEGFQLSNGLGLSPDNQTLYFADTMAHVIYAYDVKQDGGVTNRRVFARISQDEGLPDGITVDASGYVWCALFYGGEVIRFDPDGTVERRIAIPAKQVTCMGFGGAGMDELYITTAGAYWPSEYQPAGFDPKALMGGAVYRLQTEIKGKPGHRCSFRI